MLKSRTEGYRRIDGFERFDGRKSPSDVLEDEVGTEADETEKRRASNRQGARHRERIWVWRYRRRHLRLSRVDATTMKMHRSSTSGWQAVTLGWRAKFTLGSGPPLSNGDSICNGLERGQLPCNRHRLLCDERDMG